MAPAGSASAASRLRPALGVLFVRSWERAGGIYRAMLARGFTGRFSPSVRPHLHGADYVSLLVRLQRAWRSGWGHEPFSTTVLSVRSLFHRYADGTQALQGVDFDLGAGECVALLGANGSSKKRPLCCA